MSEEEIMSRRKFMGIATCAIGGLIGLALGIPAIAFIVGPALKKDEQDWIRLGAVSKVELGTPTLFKANIKRQTGWIVSEEDYFVYVLTENGRDFIAMTNVCSHLGCRVRWITDDDHFICPCHDAAFNKDGSVAFGPPPSALDRFEVKIEDDQLFVLGG